MIVISRQLGQALVIGDDIMVQIVEMDGNRVRLGVSAPRNCSIWKEEHLVVPDAVVHAEKPREENP
jgi:carbon storage regulator